MRKALAALALLLAGCAGTMPRSGPPPSDLVFLGSNARGYAEYRRLRDGMVVIHIPAGPYPRRAYERDATTLPPQTVEVPGYLIDKFEVSNRQMAAFLNATGSEGVVKRPWGLRKTSKGWQPQLGYANHPAVGVTGGAALRYAAWVGGALPDPDQWMKAAGGPEGLEYPFGAWRGERSPVNWNSAGTAPVDAFLEGASPVGCLNMAGNVYERVQGGWGPTMLKGGSWATSHPLNLRVLDMCGQPMDATEQSVGFRCVMPESVLGAPRAVRLAHSLEEGLAEARKRNCPILLSLDWDTCGQCDRFRRQVLQDPGFAKAAEEGFVVVLGQRAGDAKGHPHPAREDGSCSLHPGITCAEHEAIFDAGLGVVGSFRMSPGNFILRPDGSVLLSEMDVPKSAEPGEYLAKLREAQEQLRPR